MRRFRERRWLGDGVRGLVELPEGDGAADEDGGPEDDEDRGGPLGGDLVPEVQDVAAVVDAEPGGDGVAGAAADGEGGEELVRDILSAPAARTKGESGMGGGRMAGRATARMAWFSIQSQTRLKMRGGCAFRGRLCRRTDRPGS